MRFFLLKSVVVVVALFLAAGFGYDYYLQIKYPQKVLPEYSLPDSIENLGTTNAIENKWGDPELFNEIENEKNYLNIISRLDSAKQINQGRVGNHYYTWENACYDQLVKIATDKQLIYLLGHKNPVVRGYSFMALAERNKNLAKDNLWRLEKDTCKVKKMGGDCSIILPLHFFAEHWAGK